MKETICEIVSTSHIMLMNHKIIILVIYLHKDMISH